MEVDERWTGCCEYTFWGYKLMLAGILFLYNSRQTFFSLAFGTESALFVNFLIHTINVCYVWIINVCGARRLGCLFANLLCSLGKHSLHNWERQLVMCFGRSVGKFVLTSPLFLCIYNYINKALLKLSKIFRCVI